MSVLDRILETTRDEIATLSEVRCSSPHTPIDVTGLLRRRGPLSLIAEIKHRSPSAGALSTALSVEDRARVYAAAGASMISVLVDRAHFAGGFDQLARARDATRTPLLAKGFVIDERQVEAARTAGADAILLIARVLASPRLEALHDAAAAAGLTPIVEVVDEEELARTIACGARVIGVNARDLATLEMDAARAARVLDAIPADRVALFFSGLGTAADVARVARIGRDDGRRPIDGALIGEALMRLDSPAELLLAMKAAAAT